MATSPTCQSLHYIDRGSAQNALACSTEAPFNPAEVD